MAINACPNGGFDRHAKQGRLSGHHESASPLALQFNLNKKPPLTKKTGARTQLEPDQNITNHNKALSDEAPE
jgi:hypothetical protein